MTGFINVNKAAGASSAKEVAVIKKLTHMPCGHMGLSLLYTSDAADEL